MNTALHKVNAKYIYITAAAVLASWVLHEFAHWLMGEALGYDMGMSLNKTFVISGVYRSERDYQLLSVAGPAFTLLQAIVIFLILKRDKSVLLYPFLLVCFYMRFFAAVISFRHPNDEARISTYLGIGKFTLPLLITLFLWLLIYKTSQTHKLSLGFSLLTLGLIIFFSSIIIIADQLLHIRLL